MYNRVFMTEQWRPVKDWEGIYDVSDQGRVQRVAPRPDWKGGGRIHSATGKRVGVNPARVLRPMLKSGYLQVCLARGSRLGYPRIHWPASKGTFGQSQGRQ